MLGEEARPVMNESNLLYRVFINFCVTITIGFVVVLAEYAVMGEKSINLNILWSIFVSGAVIGIVFEALFANILPLSGNNLRRNILWRNRMICAFVNAIIVSVLGKVILGTGLNLWFLLIFSIALCVGAVIVGGLISDIRCRHSIKEMNRRLEQLKNVKGGYDSGSTES